jgi:hypothetical protein
MHPYHLAFACGNPLDSQLTWERLFRLIEDVDELDRDEAFVPLHLAVLKESDWPQDDDEPTSSIAKYEALKTKLIGASAGPCAEEVAVFSFVTVVLAYLYRKSRPQSVLRIVRMHRKTISMLRVAIDNFDEDNRRSLQDTVAHAAKSIDSLTEELFRHERIYLRFCEVVARPLLSGNDSDTAISE